MIRLFAVIFFIFSFSNVRCQHYDTLVAIDSAHKIKMMAYPRKDAVYLYPKPRTFTFLKNIPGTFALAAKESFKKESIGTWAVIVGSTGLLLWADQPIVDGVQGFSKDIGLS